VSSKTLGEILHVRGSSNDECMLVLATDAQLEGFTPRIADCHGNAEAWVKIHPTHTVERGFLVVNDFFFIKHSVIRAGSVLWDITPRPSNESVNLLAFIPLDGGDEELFKSWPPQVIYA
jgi:hypothetical protein